MSAETVEHNSAALLTEVWRVSDAQDASGVPHQFPQTDEGAAHLARLLAFPTERPWVRSMMNLSLDGAIGGGDSTSASIGNPTDFFTLTVMRALPDVIIAGAGTIRAEDYRRPSGRACVRALGLRPRGASYPALAVLTRSGDIPEALNPDWPTLLVTPTDSRAEVVRRTGFPEDHVIAADSPRETIDALVGREYRGIQLEGGAGVLASFLEARVVDELAWTSSHLTVGGNTPRLAAGEISPQEWSLQRLFVGAEATLQIFRRRPASPSTRKDEQ